MKGRRISAGRTVFILFICAAAAAVVCLILLPAGQQPDGGVTVHFIDVGQGDATLLLMPEHAVLIDAGPNLSEQKLTAYLHSLGVKRLDCLILTHPHEDHVGGADAVLDHFEVETLILPAATPDDTDTAAADRVTAHTRTGTEVRLIGEETAIDVGPASLLIMVPSGEAVRTGNDQSLVVRVTVGDAALLVMGDAEEAAERSLLERYRGTDKLTCDVLRVGHHGASESTSDALLDEASPSAAVISVGAGNGFGHPTERVLSALGARGIDVCRTDRDGTVVMRFEGPSLIRVRRQDTE